MAIVICATFGPAYRRKRVELTRVVGGQGGDPGESAACRLHIDPEDPTRFATLLKGKRAFATSDIAALLRDEFFASVLVPEIARRQSAEFRGNSMVQRCAAQQGRTRPVDDQILADGERSAAKAQSSVP